MKLSRTTNPKRNIQVNLLIRLNAQAIKGQDLESSASGVMNSFTKNNIAVYDLESRSFQLTSEGVDLYNTIGQ